MDSHTTGKFWIFLCFLCKNHIGLYVHMWLYKNLYFLAFSITLLLIRTGKKTFAFNVQFVIWWIEYVWLHLLVMLILKFNFQVQFSGDCYVRASPTQVSILDSQNNIFSLKKYFRAYHYSYKLPPQISISISNFQKTYQSLFKTQNLFTLPPKFRFTIFKHLSNILSIGLILKLSSMPIQLY